MRKIFSLPILVIFLIIGTELFVGAVSVEQKPYTTYTYSYDDLKEQPTAKAYVPTKVIYGEDLNCGSLKGPKDIFVDAEKDIYYIADTGNNRVLTVDSNNKCINELTTFDNNGISDSIKTPEGICIDNNGYLFIADSGNNRLLKFDSNYNLVHEYTKPDSTLFGNENPFKPIKVSVDEHGNIYLVCEGIYQGIVEIDENGEFVGFLGANKTNPSLWDRFWQSVSTQAQRKNMQSFIPVAFTNIDLDESNFLLATAQLENNQSNSGVKRLNLGGVDVIKTNDQIPMIGDISNTNSGSITGKSSFSDICYVSDGIFAVTDITRGKIFFYNEDGDLLFCFGSGGSQSGNIMSPSAIDANGLNIYVLDSNLNQITIFEPTAYCETMFLAVKSYREGNYDLSNKYYNQLIKQNSNCEFAYIGIGKAELRNGNYKAAMQSFKLANNKQYYSSALKGYRKQIIEKIFIPIFFIILALILFLILRPVFKKRYSGKIKNGSTGKPRPVLSGMEHGMYLVLHPFKGYSDIKYENAGNFTACGIIFLIYTASLIFKAYSTGFLFMSANENSVNVFLEIATA
ncbi:MAG: hypothetical protein GX957_16080, partial [Clostridiaceae bacterium]|nr:hypothetical protein [Clostridiaceae bacterium]